MWIEDGEKYALIGLSVKFDRQLSLGEVAPDLWALADLNFDVPLQWQEWLGSIRIEEFGACNLFLLSKLASLTPDVLDTENKKLQERVGNFYVGLLLASTFAPAHRPVMLTGSRRGEEIGVRQHQNLDTPVPDVVRKYPSVTPENMQLAVQLAANLEAMSTSTLFSGQSRLFRVLHIHNEARTNANILDRIHQYCRCIEGLILPDAGNTKRQFKSRTELFVGTRHHDMMGELYDIRSAVEHLHEYRLLEPFDRAKRLDLLKKAAIVEHIARTCLARIVGDAALCSHFTDTPTLAKFWELKADERLKIWGDPIKPLEVVANFDPKYIHDGELGLHE